MVSNSQSRPKILYGKEVEITETLARSSQAVVYKGREVSTGVKVIIKSYKQNHMKGIFRELKILTHIENMRKVECGEQTVRDVILRRNNFHDGLPCVLGYKFRD